MDVISFQYVSLGSSTVQRHHSSGSRGACASSEAGFSCENGDRAWGLYYRRAAFCCALFCEKQDSMQRMLINKCFLFRVGGVCRVKRFTAGLRKSLKDVGNSQIMPDQVALLETATEETVQRVEQSIRAHRRIMIDSVATALGCSHGSAYKIMHDHLKLRKVCAGWVPREIKDRKNWTEWICPRNISYGTQMKEKRSLTGLLLGDEWLITPIKARFNAMENVQFTLKQKFKVTP
jgi:hypothetical protein